MSINFHPKPVKTDTVSINDLVTGEFFVFPAPEPSGNAGNALCQKIDGGKGRYIRVGTGRYYDTVRNDRIVRIPNVDIHYKVPS